MLREDAHADESKIYEKTYVDNVYDRTLYFGKV